MAGDGKIRLGPLLVAAVCAAASPALAAEEPAEKPLIAIVPFRGPTGRVAEAAVVRALRKKAALVPPVQWAASAKKLFAQTTSPEDIAAVADDVGAMVVVTGVVKRDGRAWQLVISVRDGRSGKARDRLRYPLKKPRVEAKTLALLTEEVDAAFEHALSIALEGAPPPAPPAKPEPEAPKVAASDGGQGGQAGEAEAEAPKPEGDGAGEAPKAAELAKAGPADRRPRWAPFFDVSAGATLSGRAFDFTPSSLPHFASGVVGGLRVDLTVYPLASLWRRARGVISTLGLGATLDKPFWPASPALDGNSYATNELSVEGGLRWRFVLYKKLPRPELTVLGGAGLHQFSIAKREDEATGNLVDVGPPDVAYVYGTVGAGARVHFAEWSSLWAQASYRIVARAGQATRIDDGYGPADSYGLRVQGGLDFFVYRGLKLGLVGYYERYELRFTGSDPPPAKPGNGELARRAIDQYFGGLIALGYVF